MSRPPLYSRTGNTSPTAGTDPEMMMPGPNTISSIGNGGGAVSDMNPLSDASLLDKAQQFSAFAVYHVEEVRQALVNTADTKTTIIGNEEGNSFGGKNGTDITKAFDELTAAYEKLSSLKWDAARMEFEEGQRSQNGTDMRHIQAPIGPKSDGKVEKRVTVMTSPGATDTMLESRGVKEHPWQEDEEMDPLWISDAFIKAAISSEEDEDEGGDSFPVNGRLASLNAGAEPYDTVNLATKGTASTPPGFRSEFGVNGVQEKQAVASDDTKPTMQSLTSISSEISSLHTSSHPCTDDDTQDSDSDYSDSSSSSEDLPSLANFDYVYKGGYAMQVSGGKETKGVVPKNVKRVLVDPSVQTIEEGAFQGCNALESVTIPSTVEAIGNGAFRKCSKLRSVAFLTRKSRRRRVLDEKEKQAYRRSRSAPSSITEPRSSRLRSIGEWAFFNCSSLSAVKLPYGLESIGTRAFQRCSSASITELPKTLTTVGENAFYGTPRETKAAYDRWEKEHAS